MQSFAASFLRQAKPPPTEAFSRDAGPVEISMDLLAKVSGAGPRGGWEDPLAITEEAAVTESASGPRGGW